MTRVRRRGFLLAFLLGGGRGLRAADGLELVMFERLGCPYCRRWLAEIGPIYARTEEGRAAPLRRVDLAGPRPADLAGVEGLIYTPTFVLVRDGRELGRITGYAGDAFFWGQLQELLRHAHDA